MSQQTNKQAHETLSYAKYLWCIFSCYTLSPMYLLLQLCVFPSSKLKIFFFIVFKRNLIGAFLRKRMRNIGSVFDLITPWGKNLEKCFLNNNRIEVQMDRRTARIYVFTLKHFIEAKLINLTLFTYISSNI